MASRRSKPVKGQRQFESAHFEPALAGGWYLARHADTGEKVWYALYEGAWVDEARATRFFTAPEDAPTAACTPPPTLEAAKVSLCYALGAHIAAQKGANLDAAHKKLLRALLRTMLP